MDFLGAAGGFAGALKGGSELLSAASIGSALHNCLTLSMQMAEKHPAKPQRSAVEVCCLPASDCEWTP